MLRHLCDALLGDIRREKIDIRCQKNLADTSRRIFLEKSVAAKYFKEFSEPLHYAATSIFHVFLQQSTPAFFFRTFLKMSIFKNPADFFSGPFFIFIGGLITKYKF
jgi:hypothetical protein